MKTVRITTLVCLFTLLFVGYSFSSQPVTEAPVNIVTWGAGYDYRQSLPFLYPGYRVGETLYTGEEGVSGGYFFVAAIINPGLGSCLTDHSQIKEVKAKWLGDPEIELSLAPTPCLNQLPNSPYASSQAWVTPLRPAAWMFTGTWEFTLVYDCPIDGLKHKQTREVQPNPPDTIPPKPTGILVEKSTDGNYFFVSWIGMGNPSTHPWFDYRLSVIRDEDTCPIAVFGNRFGGIWSYADGPNRIKFTVPIVYGGKTIRVEQGNAYNMPPRPPGTLGGAPNRASVDIRLPD